MLVYGFIGLDLDFWTHHFLAGAVAMVTISHDSHKVTKCPKNSISNLRF